MLYQSVLIAATVLLAKTYCFNYDYTISMSPGRRECFYQPIVEQNVKVEFEYQVLDDTPINFQIKNPRGVAIHSDMRKPQNIVELTLNDPGIYEVCVLHRYDNNPKQVFVSLFSESDDKHWPFSQVEDLADQKDEAEQYLEMAVDSFKRYRTVVNNFDNSTPHPIGKEYMDNLGTSLEKMRYLQQSIRTSNVKDYIVQRGNSSRVTTFSAIQLAVMVITSIIQVITIRRLFGSDLSEARKMKMST